MTDPTAASRLRRVARRVLPSRAVVALRARGLDVRPPRGMVRFGSLRRLEPISRRFGFDRGTPVDRYYIERFLGSHGGAEGDIRGNVLEIGDDTYARRFGDSGASGVVRVEILDVDPANPRATIVADLARADDIPGATFDCIICTQTLLLVADTQAAIATLFRLLRPGGILLLTVPGISQICRPEMDRFGDYWRFTTRSLQWLLGHSFRLEDVQVQAYGNVLTAISFLHGIAAEELQASELDHLDRDYELVICARALRSA